MTQGSKDRITASRLGEVKEGYIYVWGSVAYDDGFGRVCETAFCHRYNIAAGDDAVVMSSDRNNRDYIPHWDGRYHQHGNEAT